MSHVRVRFAPSPTGHLHVGNVRTALFNWLFARHQAGTFILRIEDTDAERSTPASEAAILADLRWLGLDWDEGPEAGGAFGPYRQSERLPLYREATDTLLAAGRAYYCFCSTPERAAARAALRAAGRPPQYGGRCRGLDPAAARDRVAAGEPAAVRFAVRADRAVAFDDLVRGRVTVAGDQIGDPVIVRTNGMPAYNFAAVVDDGRMRISHVVRGEDHLSNTPRQILLYEALGLPVPAFAHLSMVLGPDEAPLSKRHGATSVVEFRESGVLPEALVNYLALLGWSPGADEELVALDEMARRFDLAAVGRSASTFDLAKLAWVNRHYLRTADPGRLVREARPFLSRAGLVDDLSEAGVDYLVSLLPMVAGAVDRLAEIPERLRFAFDWDADRAAAAVRRDADGPVVARALAATLEGRQLADREAFRGAAAEVRAATGLAGRRLFHPIRVCLTGEDSGPELDLALPGIDRGAALGPDAGVRPVASCAARAAAVVARLDAGPAEARRA